MKKIKLSQSWVTRMTSDITAEDLFVSGHDREGVPSEEEVAAVVSKTGGTDAVREMVRRKWFTPESSDDRQMSRGKALQEFLYSARVHRRVLAATAMYRRQFRQRDLVDEMATLAWLCRVTDEAVEMKSRATFDNDKLDSKAISHLVHLSTRPSGPSDAIRYLKKIGITVVLENSLPGMRTDGVSFFAKGAGPVIGLTLRYDRLDSFWFTLLHEVGHVALHLSESPEDVFVDSFEDDETDELEVEAEANAFAKDAFVPRDTWLRSDAFRFGTESAVVALAKKCSIHPAIVAGRLRFEKRKYHALSNLLGAGELRGVLMAE